MKYFLAKRITRTPAGIVQRLCALMCRKDKLFSLRVIFIDRGDDLLHQSVQYCVYRKH